MNEALEYDLFIRIRPEDIHVLCYIAEAEDNLMNIRHVTDEGLLKIIVPADLLEELKSFLQSIKKRIDLEVVEIRANPGHT
ncbi:MULTISPECIES: DUF4911 domain-containing protein [unclassified Mesotoga]|jgi:glycine cleavage system regulatory protein|uniref:DUF4911 domain-containing protein n=1 Tax=Mesotoga prima TaxID=1184387 RepID=A0A124FYL4_9BACT|nr:MULTISPECIES: DUF4911 domain-containing protein [unclassified Mesotoga]KUK81551.1 MAG: Uncharacterized protein XD94_0410 [Mesotoga prima]PXF35130.1 hypothetical protein EU77_03545 [Mesotoga sp. SC_NapDC]RAM60610.1 hypothetical protein DS67_01810 [Mesotoga sp. SC_4PWA21]RAM61121.1 hypothetical protein DS66_04395 [Mesotoga sp. SC_3PWM13N19]RIZ61346.1 hypothetical protein KU43_03070 [Mesotoga sp. SC_NapDC2]